MMPINTNSWTTWITQLKTEVGTHITTEKETEIIKSLAGKLEQTVLKLAKNKKSIGLLFSGGVDSTIIGFILKKNNIPFKAISVGFHDENQKLPEDIEQAKVIGDTLNFDHEQLILDFSKVEPLFKEIANILGKDYANVVNAGVGSVELAGIKYLKSQGVDCVFGGLGSEELFAGYDRHSKSDDKHEECWQGLQSMFERDMVREQSISKAQDTPLLVPFLDEELIKYAMIIPVEYKINDEEKKIILRKACVLLGLPKEYAFRPKRAAQYGSRTDRAIAKLTKRAGYQYKKDYLLSLID